MRKKMVAANWKMHASREEAKALLCAVAAGLKSDINIDVVICPSFVYLPLAENILSQTTIAWGGQNMHINQCGAFTGEISGPMLAEFGARYVLIGHSERRSVFHETLSLITAKFKSALQFGLQPILCIGETQVEREQNNTETVLKNQLEAVLTEIDIRVFNQAILAYEPVWAIGTGLTASPDQAEEAHRFIRAHLAQYNVDVANTVRILYGGSVKADNAASLFAMPNIDGGLIGGASLNAQGFLDICQAASQVS